MKYGNAPAVPTHFDPVIDEMMFYLYLPIKMPHSSFQIPPRLRRFHQMTDFMAEDASAILDLEKHYVYLTAKTLFVEPGAPGNRPGWHVDGWGSNGDLNYIWSDRNPTEFCIQSFENVPDEDFGSLRAFKAQARPENTLCYPDKTLLRLDETVVHRVNPVVKPGVRTFVKYSVSRHRYNLKGNSHNYLFDYDWHMYDRQVLRNIDNKDYVNADASGQ